jgi:DNA ligase-1
VDKIEVNVAIFAFDVIYLNGESVLAKSLAERRQILFENFTEIPNKFMYVQYQNVSSFEDVESLLYESVKDCCEGLMVKTLHQNASYEPDKRTFNWLKLKKDYIDDSSLGDSVDVVPIGAYYGSGKRTGVYGSFVLAVWNSETEQFQSITKIGTGFTDEML